MEQVCFNDLPTVVVTAMGILAAIAGSSAVANWVGKDSTFGKILNWIALNFKVQKK